MCRTPTSLLDVLPTLVELAGGSAAEMPRRRSTGVSLVPLASGGASPGRRVRRANMPPKAAIAPMVMIREGAFKYIHSEPDPPLLFDLAIDPGRADEPRRRRDAMPRSSDRFRAVVAERWDLGAFEADVLASQARRRLVYEALRNGALFPVGFPAASKSVGALHAQPLGPERARSLGALPAGGKDCKRALFTACEQNMKLVSGGAASILIRTHGYRLARQAQCRTAVRRHTHGAGRLGSLQPLLIIAGAGSGKTNTLAHRVAARSSNGADPRRILLLTFSRRAAAEMARRVERIVAAVPGRGRRQPARR